MSKLSPGHEWEPRCLRSRDGRVVTIELCRRCGAISKLDRGVRYDTRTGETISPDCDYETMKKVHES